MISSPAPPTQCLSEICSLVAMMIRRLSSLGWRQGGQGIASVGCWVLGTSPAVAMPAPTCPTCLPQPGARLPVGKPLRDALAHGLAVPHVRAVGGAPAAVEQEQVLGVGVVAGVGARQHPLERARQVGGLELGQGRRALVCGRVESGDGCM